MLAKHSVKEYSPAPLCEALYTESGACSGIVFLIPGFPDPISDQRRKNMKKRLVAMLLVLLLCMTLFPVSALAAGTSPFTGDESNVTLWIVVGVVAAAAVAAIVIYLLKKQDDCLLILLVLK